MNYCSVKEAWGDTFGLSSQLYNKPNNTGNATAFRNINYPVKFKPSIEAREGRVIKKPREYQHQQRYYPHDLERFENVEKLSIDPDLQADDLDSAQDQLYTPDYRVSCEQYLKHIKHCPRCKEEIRIIILKAAKKESKKEAKKERSSRVKESDLKNMAMFIIGGIFLILLMDTFMKLGQMYKK